MSFSRTYVAGIHATQSFTLLCHFFSVRELPLSQCSEVLQMSVRSIIFHFVALHCYGFLRSAVIGSIVPSVDTQGVRVVAVSNGSCHIRMFLNKFFLCGKSGAP